MSEEKENISSRILNAQRQEAYSYNYYEYDVLCYPYAYEWNNKKRLDIYFYFCDANNKIIEKKCEIELGMVLEPEEEHFFVSLLKCDSILYGDRCMSIIDDLANMLPDYHITMGDIGLILLNCYYSALSTCYELLFKAGLVYIASNVDRLELIDKSANNIENMIGIPLAMLRKLDNEDSLENILEKREWRNKASIVYKKYHSILNKFEIINIFQICYLYECNKFSQLVDKTMLECLSSLSRGWLEELNLYVDDIDLYKELFEYQEIIKKMDFKRDKYFDYYPKFESSDSFEKFYKNYGFLRLLEKQRSDVDESLANCYCEYKQLEYENKQYIFYVPRNVRMILDEAKKQKNCLVDYVFELARGDIQLVIVRRKEALKKGYITVMIENNRIIEVKGSCNVTPDENQRQLIRKYADLKNLQLTRGCFYE